MNTNYYHDFEEDLGYQIQQDEAEMSRAAIRCNREQTDEYMRNHFCDLDADQPVQPIVHFDLTASCSEHTILDPDPRLLPVSERQPTALEDADAHRTRIMKNLKQCILNAVQERNAHFKLKRQVAIMDALNPSLDRDPVKLLAIVGYQALIANDEFYVPRTAKLLGMDYEERSDAKRRQLAEAFCLLEISDAVIESCDKHSDRNRGAKPLYLLG